MMLEDTAARKGGGCPITPPWGSTRSAGADLIERSEQRRRWGDDRLHAWLRETKPNADPCLQGGSCVLHQETSHSLP